MNKKKKTVLLTGIGGLLILITAYIIMAVFCMKHFNFGTTINGVNVGGKNVAEAEAMIRNQLNTYQITLLERENKTEVISGNDIDVELVLNDEVAKMLNEQNGFAWIADLMKKPAYELEQRATYNEEKLEEQLALLNAMKPENQREPVNAGYSEYTEQGYRLIPADYGTKLNQKILKKAVGKAVEALETTVDLDEANCYVLPKIGDDHRSLNALIETLNKYVATEIHYEFGSEDEVLAGDTIATWLSVDNNMEVVVDADAVLQYVKGLARRHNTAYSAKTLMTSYGKEVKISGGAYGWRIDNGGERNQIIEDIKTGDRIEREAVFLTRANSFDGPDYGNSYVEINLSAQHLFLYVDGELIVDTDFVSGRITRGNQTPAGCFPLTYKTEKATLRGRDYETPVDYWMPFNGNIGMHDLTSRKKFGGAIYQTNGSHGCINLPWEAAKTIYQHVEKGFPVLCYYLDGSESDEVRAQKVATTISRINIIGPVTPLSGPAIVEARRLYDELGPSLKAQVSNYQTLVNAEAQWAALNAQTP